jgi:hypothetical protein
MKYVNCCWQAEEVIYTYARGHVVRVVCLSDTHWEHRRIRVTDGDILIHCGDFSTRGVSLPSARLILIAHAHALHRLCLLVCVCVCVCVWHRAAEPGDRVQ